MSDERRWLIYECPECKAWDLTPFVCPATRDHSDRKTRKARQVEVVPAQPEGLREAAALAQDLILKGEPMDAEQVLDAALSELPSQPRAWIEVEHGDVQRTHPNVPDLPNGRYYLSELPSSPKGGDAPALPEDKRSGVSVSGGGLSTDGPPSSSETPQQGERDLPLPERMDDPFRARWYEFCNGLSWEQRGLILEYLNRRSTARQLEELVKAGEALLDVAKEHRMAHRAWLREKTKERESIYVALTENYDAREVRFRDALRTARGESDA